MLFSVVPRVPFACTPELIELGVAGVILSAHLLVSFKSALNLLSLCIFQPHLLIMEMIANVLQDIFLILQ